MVLDRNQGTIRHDVFSNIGMYLPPNSTFVLNNTKVISARLIGRKAVSGADIEVFLLKALEDGYSFEVLIRPLKKVRVGDLIVFTDGVEAILVDRDRRIVRFNTKNVLDHLQNIGHIPLPPYIKRTDEPSDAEDYQTVYAKQLGSVAAPTAGLHFTDDLIRRLKTEGHLFKELTLHINYGTFKPVECYDIRQHPMHSESYEVDEEVEKKVSDAKLNKQSIVAVGTTSCRVLESIALNQSLQGDTDIFIYPGFVFKSVDVLVTNFHLPYSTLLMLVCAFGGYDLVMRAYQEAIKERYRFYSYGDAMLIV